MNRKLLLGVVGLVVITALAITAYSLKDRILSWSRPQTAATQPAAGHQNHGTAGESQTAKDDQVQATERQAPTLEIASEKQQMIGTQTADVSIRPLRKILRTTGRIEADEQKIATINAKFEGWIERLYADTTGKTIRRGDPLADFYSPDLTATQQEYLNLLQWKKGSDGREINPLVARDADNILAAARRRLQLWDISDEQIRRLEETGKSMRTMTLYSPVNGTIVQKNAVLGMRVMPGDKLFDVADLSTLWIIADVYEQDLDLVRVGLPARFTISAMPGKTFTAPVEYIYPTLAGETRTAKLRFRIGNAGMNLRPQMFTSMELIINLGRLLSVPEDAVLDTGERRIVYVVRSEGEFEPREVRTGVQADGFVEILEGLRSGDKVAASATFLIDSEAQLKGVRPLSGGHKTHNLE
ncbi:MAG: efflux RND transporter periplasmic adaptor subunit [Deltaproteobacteria bacterium HGW-Deltaproteobacteria-19]|jgi:Cu(I)/Ag(I) efflux system membrane fusion protein|nr:MAG: efflux RND transporter periplasmic adaptor subunit [Deltaproteobacteria bacterium HGW-Deltaproteobacteria-19]